MSTSERQEMPYTIVSKTPIKSINIPIEVNNGTFSLTRIQYLLLMYVFTNVNPDSNNLLRYFVDVRSFKKAINNNSSDFYDDIAKDIETFWNKTILTNTSEQWIDGKTGKIKTSRGVKKNRFLREIEYLRDDLMIDMLFEEKVFENILSKIQTSYIKTDNILSKFSNFQQTRLYTILNQIKSMNSIWIISFEKLVQKLGLTHVNDEETKEEEKRRIQEQEYYGQYKNFKRRILTPTINQINKHSNFTVVLEEIKQGKNVKNLKFRLLSKSKTEEVEKQILDLFADKKEILNIPSQKMTQSDEKDLKSLLISEGVTPKSAAYWIREKGEEYCQTQYEYVKKMKTPIKGFAAYFVTACRGNYAKF